MRAVANGLTWKKILGTLLALILGVSGLVAVNQESSGATSGWSVGCSTGEPVVATTSSPLELGFDETAGLVVGSDCTSKGKWMIQLSPFWELYDAGVLQSGVGGYFVVTPGQQYDVKNKVKEEISIGVFLFVQGTNINPSVSYNSKAFSEPTPLEPSYSKEIRIVCPGSVIWAYSKRANSEGWDLIQEITASPGQYFSIQTDSCWTKMELDPTSDVVLTTETAGSFFEGAALTEPITLSTSSPGAKTTFMVKEGISSPKFIIKQYAYQSSSVLSTLTLNIVPISPATDNAVTTRPGTFYVCASDTGGYVTSGPGGTGNNLLAMSVLIGADKTNQLTIVNECTDHYGLGSWNQLMRPISFQILENGKTESIYEISSSSFDPNDANYDFPNFALYFYKKSGTSLYGQRGAELGIVQFRKASLATFPGGFSGAPGSPSLVQATAGSGQATVSWSVPTSGGTPTSYSVSSNPPGGVCQTVHPTLSCTVAGLTNGTNYTFTVTATNSGGTSAPSAPSTDVTPSESGAGDGGGGNPSPIRPPTQSPSTPTINLPSNGGSTGGVGTASTQPGQVFTLTGSGMNNVNTVNVGSQRAVITLKTATKLGFKIPKNLPAGLHDLSLYGSFGSMTEAKFFSIAKKKIKTRALGFAGNSPALTSAQKSEMRIFLNELPGKVTLVCNGSTSSSTVTAFDRKLARDRARKACDYARELNPTLQTEIRITPAEGVGYKYRSVKLTLKNY